MTAQAIALALLAKPATDRRIAKAQARALREKVAWAEVEAELTRLKNILIPTHA